MKFLKMKCILVKEEIIENSDLYKDMGININNEVEEKEGFVYINPKKIIGFFAYDNEQIKILTEVEDFIVSYSIEEFIKIMEKIEL